MQASRSDEGVLRARRLRMDPRTRSVRCDGRDVALCPVEFELLRALMCRAGQVQSLSQLAGWLRSTGRMTRGTAVPVHIHHLRRKIGGELIRTVRGAGYVLPPEDGDR